MLSQKTRFAGYKVDESWRECQEISAMTGIVVVNEAGADMMSALISTQAT
jgi:hypothetical protein